MDEEKSKKEKNIGLNNNIQHESIKNYNSILKGAKNIIIDDYKDNNKKKVSKFRPKNLYIFNSILFQIILVLLPIKVMPQFDFMHYINITFQEEGFHQVLSDAYKDILFYKVLINGIEEQIGENNYVSVQNQSVVTLLWNNTISDFSYMFSNLMNISEIYLYNMSDSYCNMTYMFNNCTFLTNITFNEFIEETSELDVPIETTMPFSNETNMTYEISEPIQTSAPELIGSLYYLTNDTKGMFYNCQSLTRLDLKYLRTEEVKDMSYMFYNCTQLSGIYIGFFANSLTVNMKGMFLNCQGLTSLYLSSFHTPNVEIMWDMFKGCSSLQYLILSGFDTSKVTDMVSMFEGCSNLISLDLSHFNTSNVQHMNRMFRDCRSLEILNFQNISSESLGTMYQMFYNCQKLRYLNIYSLIEDVQSIFEMFEGASNNFTFCVKENENIPNIFEILKQRDTIRDCSIACYGNESERISVIRERLCCPSFEFNGSCYDQCPGRTKADEGSKKCEIFNCTNFYNYTQDGCIDVVPDGFYVNDTNLNTIERCHENCITCDAGPTNITTNCLKCNDVVPYLYLGNCLENCDEGTYSEGGITKCKCFNNVCKKCNRESLELGLCQECNDDYYQIENDLIVNSTYKKCYKDPEGYFLNNTVRLYQKCYSSCKYCTGLGDKHNQLCTACNSDTSFGIPMKNNHSILNCYPNCTLNYFFNETNDYQCYDKEGCPPEANYLINGTRECVKSCEGTDNNLEFRHICYQDCPDESILDETRTYCKPQCPFARPFEIRNSQLCVSTCGIMERYLGECVTNYDGDRIKEVHDMILTDIQNDMESFNYSFITENLSLILEEKDVFYEITSTNCTPTDNRISRINLGECEYVLKDYYSIDYDEPLYILKIDAYVEGKVGPNVNYEVYYPFSRGELHLLDLSICEGIDIFIGFAVNISEDDIDLYDGNSAYYSDICYPTTNDDGVDITLEDRQNEYADKNMSLCEEDCTFAGYDKKTGSAKCSCGVKVSITMMSDLSVDKAKLYKFMNLKTIANFKVLKCMNLLFSKKGIVKNIGFYSFIPTFIMYFVCIFILYIKELKVIKYQINEIVFAKRNIRYVDRKLKKDSYFKMYLENKQVELGLKKDNNPKKSKFYTNNNYQNNENGLSENDNKFEGKKSSSRVRLTLIEENKNTLENENININDNSRRPNNDIYNVISTDNFNKFNKVKNSSINKLNTENGKNDNIENKKIYKGKKNLSEIEDKENINSNKKKNDKKKKKPNFNEKQEQKIRDILYFNHAELDDLEYKYALKLDQRRLMQYYYSLLSSNHLIIKVFDKTDYNSRSIKIFLCFFNFSSCYAVNALFFNDDTMHQIYEDGGDFNIIYQLPQIIYSTVISFIIDNVSNYLALCQDDIINLKQDKKVKYVVKRAKATIRGLYLKFLSFFFLSLVLMLVFWYYLGCFCAVYNNTQYHLIKDTLISFGTGLLTPFATSFIPALFRIAALKEKTKAKKFIYQFSLFLSKYIV